MVRRNSDIPKSPAARPAYPVPVSDVLDEGPFFHGTKADLQTGEFLTAGFRSNYRPEVVMNHIYFTALQDGSFRSAEPLRVVREMTGGRD